MCPNKAITSSPNSKEVTYDLWDVNEAMCLKCKSIMEIAPEVYPMAMSDLALEGIK